MNLFEHILGEAVTLNQEPPSDDGLLVATTHEGRELALRVFHKDISEYTSDLFKISLVNTPNVGERQVTSLRFAGKDTSTCGYVFPITSLRTGEYLPEGKWPAVYAAAATRALVETDIAVPLVTDTVSGVGELEITDLLPGNLGVLILGCDQLAAATTSIEAVELMLMEYGYVPRSFNIFSSAVLSQAPDYEERVSLRLLATHLVDEVLGLRWLMASTSVQQTTPGKFLTLYQILECLLTRVFGKIMDHIVADPRSKTDPWWLRDMVQTILNEKWRLNFIERYCLRQGMSHACFADSREACQNLLVALNRLDPGTNMPSWAGALYASRNIFVHNQTALREVDEMLVVAVCETLQHVCFDVMVGYADPSSDFLNPGT